MDYRELFLDYLELNASHPHELTALKHLGHSTTTESVHYAMLHNASASIFPESCLKSKKIGSQRHVSGMQAVCKRYVSGM